MGAPGLEKSKIHSLKELVKYNEGAIVSKIIKKDEKANLTVFAFDNDLPSILGLDFFPALWVIICLPFIVYLLVSVIKNQICLLFITSFMKIEVVIVRGGWAIAVEILMMVGLSFMLSILIFF